MNKRVDELASLIERYQKSYYNGDAEVTDSEFDALWDELRRINPAHPLLHKVGFDSSDGFPKAPHIIPMGSQQKAADEAEFLDWVNKYNPTEYIVQYKLDGTSLELQYDQGRLIRAVSRGDGSVGDDITQNARKMQGVLPQLKQAWSGGVRGEVLMSLDMWREKYADKANWRNAANGIMKRKDGQGCEDLTLISYDMMASDDTSVLAEEDKMKWLKQEGFNTVETKIMHSADEIIAYRATLDEKRDDMPFAIDGLVVKLPETDLNDLRRDRPERQIAFKFPLEERESSLREVLWSESGATYTPVGIFDPVQFKDATVKQASLNNPEQIKQLGLRIGSRIVVVKRGEIIPKIISLAPLQPPESETKPILLPEKCSACGFPLVNAGSRLYCPNNDCPKRLLHRLEKWIKVLDIREVGEKLTAALFNTGLVRHIPDLYTLSEERLAPYFLEAEALAKEKSSKGAQKVLRHIMTHEQMSLAAFVAGFDFEGVAENIMTLVTAAGFDTLEKLRSAEVEDLASVYETKKGIKSLLKGVAGIGEITARVIVEGLKETKDEMDAVLAAGIISIAPPLAASPGLEAPLLGKTFCFTGELKSMKRAEAEAQVKSLGGSAKPSVVKGLSYLVTNDPLSGSAKNKRARELGVAIIDEKAFLDMLGD